MALTFEGTPYFRIVETQHAASLQHAASPQLRRAVKIHLPVDYSGPVKCQLSGGGESFEVEAIAEHGSILVCGLATFDRQIAVNVVVESAQGSWKADGILAPTRPWTIYIAQDKHLDYGWIHPVEQVIERLNTMTDFAIDHDMCWNFESSIWVDEYLRARSSARGEQLLSRLRQGAFEMAANWLVPSPGILSLEEMVRLLMVARSLQVQGVPVRTAMLQEAPSLSWGMASVLAGAGFPYLIKGAYDLRNPHLRERDPYPLAWWEGPDGSRVLLRWDCYEDTGKWGGYGEGWVFWKSTSNAERVDYIEKTIARYEAYQHYPLDAILLAGTGFDEYPHTTAVTDFIRWFNAQGWDYPRLVDATWNDYWLHIEKNLPSIQLPVVRGDWGTAWEEWPAQIARLSNLYRRARQAVHSAQVMAALAHKLDPYSGLGRKHALELAWRGLLQFAEHDFGGISADYAEDVYETKAGYAHIALREGTRALESGISTLAARLPQAEDGRALVVANPNNWQRGGVVEVVVHDVLPYEVVEVESDRVIPCQLETRGPGWLQHYLSFVARDVSGFGYRTYLVRHGETAAAAWQGQLLDAVPVEPAYENAHYRLRIHPETGGLQSLYNKIAGLELVTPGGYTFNEYLHFSDGKMYRPQMQSVVLRRGPLCDHLIIEVAGLRAKLRSTYRLYHVDPRLEIVNELYKEATSEHQASWFAFPFNASQPQYHYDGMAAILRPGLQSLGGDLLPGSGLSSTAVQSFLSLDMQGQQVILATPDAYLFQFGERILNDPLGDSDPKSPLALSLVMHNFTRNDSLVRQGGQEYFTFRYSIGLRSSQRPSQAVQFAAESAQNLPRAWVTGGEAATLPLSGSFVSVEPENIIVTGFKVAEDGQGWVLRLWECDGQDTEAVVNAGALGIKNAWICNLLEKKQELLLTQGGENSGERKGRSSCLIKVRITARSLKAIRFE